MMESHEARVAKFAMKCIDEAEANDCLEEYANRAKSAPATIMDNGLLQTVAFYAEKGREYKLLCKNVMDWLELTPEHGCSSDPITALLALSPSEFRGATARALDLLSWLKRLGAGRLKSSTSRKGDQHDAAR